MARVVGSMVLLMTTVASIADTRLEPNEYVVLHHHDALGNTVVTTVANGEVLWLEQTEPYGKSPGRRSVRGGWLAVDPFYEEEGRSRPGYTGHVRDGASGLTYMQARHYFLDLGRFLSNDPIGDNFIGADSYTRESTLITGIQCRTKEQESSRARCHPISAGLVCVLSIQLGPLVCQSGERRR